MFDRLAALEVESEAISQRIADGKDLVEVRSVMPDRDWIEGQLSDLSDILDEGGTQATLLVRRLLGQVKVFPSITPGKTRVCPQLQFTVQYWAAIEQCLSVESRILLEKALGKDSTIAMSEQFVLTIGNQSRMEIWAPQIAQMRSAGIKWREIWEITGLGRGPAYTAWKRYVEAQALGNADVGGGISDSPLDGGDGE